MYISDQEPRIPRMRTISEAAAEIRARDQHTSITPHHIRRLCTSGVLPTLKAGKKILLDLNMLIENMQNPTADKFKPQTESSASEKSGVIQRISE